MEKIAKYKPQDQDVDADSKTFSYLNSTAKQVTTDSDEEGDAEDDNEFFSEQSTAYSLALGKSVSCENQEPQVQIPKRFRIHRVGTLNKYENFNVKVSSLHCLDDFSWEEQVYGILLKYVPQFAE
jgi:hypothetical protein